jgi:hypothetical protein
MNMLKKEIKALNFYFGIFEIKIFISTNNWLFNVQVLAGSSSKNVNEDLV